MSGKNSVATIGYGYVGKGMRKIFPDALIYDPFYLDSNTKESINLNCGLAVICVPTPPKGMKEQKVNEDEEVFREVDLSYIEDVLSWLNVPHILIKSTVPPGTTARFDALWQKKFADKSNTAGICMSPEYMGESKYFVPERYPNPTDPRAHEFVIIGGRDVVADEVIKYFAKEMGPTKTYFKCSSTEAECIKYMENTWGAMKVTFMNEWFEVCKSVGASFYSVREGWALDNRVEKNHTMVFEDNRGFAGKCYPKDLLGLIAQAEKNNYEPKLLKEVWESNKRFRKLNK